MSEPKIPYPPSPPVVPDGLTEYAELFTRQQKRLLTGLFVFLIFYLAMMALFGMVAVWCALTLSGKYAVFKVVGLVLSGTFFLFLLKGFFKRHVLNEEMYVEITERDQPVLFDFIHQLCDELGAPFPNRVFLDPEVTAECIFRTSFLNLLVEPKRDLLIGMGLVNCTNLSEFKAVLAHELGHYCDLGRTRNYCAVMQRVMFDLVEGEDFFDRFVAWCKNTGEGGGKLRMALWPIVLPISWILEAGHAVLWVILQTIAVPSRAIALEEEFHADLVAVSAAGSDAVSHSLLRCQFGMQCLNQAIDDMVPLAHDHEMYSNDIYLHQDRAAAIVRAKHQQPELGLPPVLPDPQAGEKIRVFDEDHEDYAEEIPPMWRGHPSSVAREENAKEHFVPAVMDHRSPWILFENPAELKEEMSYQFHRMMFHIRKNADLTDAAQVQEYIDQEYPDIKPGRPPQPRAEAVLDSGEMPIRVAADSVGLPPLESLIPTVTAPVAPVQPMPAPIQPGTGTAPSLATIKSATPAPVARMAPAEPVDPIFATMPAIPGPSTMAEPPAVPAIPVNLPLPVPAMPAASVMPLEEPKSETVFDEAIEVVDPDVPEVPEADTAPVAPPELFDNLQAPPADVPMAQGSGVLGAEPIIEAAAVESAVLAVAPAEPEVADAFEATPVIEATPIAAVAAPEPVAEIEPEATPALAAVADASLPSEPNPAEIPIPAPVVETPLPLPEPVPETIAEATAEVVDTEPLAVPVAAAAVPVASGGLPFELADLLMDPAAEAAGPLPDTLLDVKMQLEVPPAEAAPVPAAEAAPEAEAEAKAIPEPIAEAAVEAPAIEPPTFAEAPPSLPVEPEPVPQAVAEPEPEPAPIAAPIAEIEEASPVNPEPEPVPPAAPVPVADASNEDESVLLPPAPTPGAAAVETIPTTAQDTFVRPPPAAPAVAFGSAPKAAPQPVDEGDDEVFVLDEVAPIPTESEGLVALDAESSGKSKAAPQAPAPASIPVQEQEQEQESIYTVDPEELGQHPMLAKESPETASKPLGKIVVPGRAAAAATAAPIPAKVEPAAPSRPAFGSGSHTALGKATVAETTVEAEGRRPALRITFVKPGEKSPIGKL